jgi:tRNA nucleotidyltransferase (CCA-adding enzyme)
MMEQVRNVNPGTDLPSRRGHEPLPHTADVGLRAWGPTPAAAFEEAAMALGELTADVATDGGRASAGGERIEIEGRDLVGLAYAWLNELVGLIDVSGALDMVRVETVSPSADGWRLQATVDLVGFDGVLVRRGADVKSATYHGLDVVDEAGAWTITAYLDV